jgi:ribose 5-phosphate isomerase B
MLYIGADHRGFELKEKLKEWLKDHGHSVEDLGAHKLEPEDDYPDFAEAVARKVSEDPDSNRGILLCGSGHGMDIVANKFKEIRAALCFNTAVAKQSREHEDANVLILAADWVAPNEAREVVKIFLETKFSGEERNERRIQKITEIEK